MNRKISINMYREYLIKLKSKVFKALCLYEEESETFDQYFKSLIYVELTGLRSFIEDLPHDVWYVESLSRLKALSDYYNEGNHNHKIMKSELFGIINLIEKQIDGIKR